MTEAREFFRFYGEGDPPPSRGRLRRALQRERFGDGPIRCENPTCPLDGATTWDGKPLGFDLDHKNGVNSDNRLSNIWFVCPNCHRVHGRYAGANAGMVEKFPGGYARVRERGKQGRDHVLVAEPMILNASLLGLTVEELAERAGIKKPPND